MARITIPGARELTIVADRDDLRDGTLTEISLGEAEAYAGLLRVLGDAAAMGTVRAVLSDVSPGVALRSLRDHEVLRELARHVADGACRVFERVSVGYRRGEGEAAGREPRAHPPQAPPGRLRPGAFAPFLGGGVAMGGAAPAAAPAAPAAPPPPAAQAAPAPEPRRAPDRKVLTVRWEAAEAWCSEEVRVTGTTREYGDGEAVLVEVRERASRRRIGSVQASVAGNAFAKGWAPNDVLPARADGKLVERMDLDGTAGGAETPKPLAMRFVPAAPRTPYASGFIGDGQLEMASHEFGHHLGNPDEYAGASGLDASLEGDGAVHGIDEDSIMGTNMTKVKKRHLRTVCAHLATMVRSKARKSYTYEPVQR